MVTQVFETGSNKSESQERDQFCRSKFVTPVKKVSDRFIVKLKMRTQQ